MRGACMQVCAYLLLAAFNWETFKQATSWVAATPPQNKYLCRCTPDDRVNPPSASSAEHGVRAPGPRFPFVSRRRDTTYTLSTYGKLR